MDEKLCPFLRAAANYQSDARCIKQRCMWWDEENKECCVVVFTKQVQVLLKRGEINYVPS